MQCIANTYVYMIVDLLLSVTFEIRLENRHRQCDRANSMNMDGTGKSSLSSSVPKSITRT